MAGLDGAGRPVTFGPFVRPLGAKFPAVGPGREHRLEHGPRTILLDRRDTVDAIAAWGHVTTGGGG